MKPEEKVTCPFCGAEIDPDAIQCPSCGNAWSDAEEREVIRSIMKIPGMGEKRTKKLFEAADLERIKGAGEDDLQEILKKAGIPMKIADRVKDRLETGSSLHLCPECGAFVPGNAEICPICGADLSAGEEEIDFTSSEVNDVHQLKDDLFLEESTNLYLCRVCGAFIMEHNERCPVCGAPMPENRADMPVSVNERLEDEEKNLRAIKGFFGVQDLKKVEKIDTDVLSSVTELDICSSCGAFVRPEAIRCPVCGAELVPEIDEEKEKEVVDEALFALEDLKNELIGAEVDVPAEEESEYVCSVCGSPVPEDAVKCPVCGTLFEDEDEEKRDAELVLSIEDVLSDEDEPIPAAQEAVTAEYASSEETVSPTTETEDERIKEEIKEEVNFIFAPLPTHKNEDPLKASSPEKEELARVLEGGMDEISPPEKSQEISLSDTKPDENPESDIDDGRWNRTEDIVMAASAVGASLLASEYLLTNGLVPNPVMAYGASSISIFLSLMVAGLVLLFLDRKRVFRTPWVNAVTASTLLFPALTMLFWYLYPSLKGHAELDMIFLALYFISVAALWKLIKDRMNPMWIWFLGIIQIVAHSLLFISDFHPWLSVSEPLPSYLLAITGGAYLVIGIYLRIDAAMRSLLSTRDVLMGHRHYMNGEYDEAMRYYSRALERKKPYEGGYDLAYYSKGTALLSAGNSLEALKYLNRAVKANPGNEMAWNNRGIALSKLGLDDGALASYEKALEINPDYDVAWNNKGNVLARMGRYRDALECYERAIKLNPEYKDAWMNKGYVLIKLDRYAEAKECADRVLRPSRKGAGRQGGAAGRGSDQQSFLDSGI